jgi:acetyl-CoA acetyltransferase
MAAVRDQPVVAGAAEVPYTRHPPDGLTTALLLEQAAASALANAGLEPRDVDGLGVCSFSLYPDSAIDLAFRLGVRLSWLMDDTAGGASALTMLTHATRGVAAGDASVIVLVAGGRTSADSFARLVDEYNVATRDHLAPIPYCGPNTLFALLTQRHMKATGLERADYGQIAIAQRRWASRNPGAAYRQPLTIEDYLTAPMVAEPLGLYDCVPVVTGANALVVTTPDRLRTRPAVRIRAVRSRHNWDRHSGDGLTTGLAPVASELWAAAAMRPEDVDVCCIYDDYPAMVLIQLADLGLIPDRDLRRHLHVDLAENHRPINTSGGMLSAGQASGNGGMHGLVEAIQQLRGEAGERQVANCRTAVVTGYGMVTYRYGACAAVAVLERV